MTPVQRHRARRGEGELLRDEIIEAATRLLTERGGEEAVSIRAIADAVGVTPPSIYMHFADKDELFLAVSNAQFTELDRRMVELGEQTSDPLEDLHNRGVAYIKFGLENPEGYRILFMDKAKHASADKVKDWAALEHMVECVEKCIASGYLAKGDPFTITLGLWAAVHGITSLMICMPDFPWPPANEIMDHVLTMCVYGLKA